MARFLSMRFAFIASSSAGLLACTAILGDFQVGANGAADSGGPDTSIPDSGTDTNSGDVTTDAKPTGFSGARAIVAGARHTCALVNLGEIYCWGDNSLGQLGAAGMQRSAKPVKVDLNGGGVAKALSSTGNHTCALTMAGAIQCWGSNASGECGNGDNIVIAPPRVVRPAVPPAPNWALLAAGVSHTCAIDEGGQTYCWGANESKQAGNIAATGANLATIAGPEKVAYQTLTASAKHTCGAKSGSNTTQCWGTEDKGALGNGAPPTDSSATALPVTYGGETKQIVSGGGHACLLDAQGDGRCWGDNAFGQLAAPVAITFLDAPGTKIGSVSLAYIAAGGDTTCGISTMNRVLACVGSNSSGQLGRGGSKDTSAHPDPQPVQRNETSGLPLDGVASVAIGREHVCAIVGTSGEVFCWGNGADGQLGDGTSGPGAEAKTVPVQVAQP